MELSELGPRICIIGPSNSGKSTLALAIGRTSALPVVHLDQLYHRPHSDWQPRPLEEFVALHDAAIARPRWVIEGNYSRCMPQRFARATGLLWLDVATPLSLWRYLRRCWFERDRAGGLEGGRDSVKWAMLHHIGVVTPRNRQRYAELYRQATLPKLALPSARAIERCYVQWGLQRAVPGRR